MNNSLTIEDNAIDADSITTQENKLIQEIEILLNSLNTAETAEARTEIVNKLPKNLSHEFLGKLTNKRKRLQTFDDSYQELSEEITCFYCKKNRPKENYSKIQLTKYISLSRHFKKAKNNESDEKLETNKICCKSCSCKPRTHLVCNICDEEKLLNEFSKRQRKFDVDARCLMCVKEDKEPIHIIVSTSDSNSDSDMGFDDHDKIIIDTIGQKIQLFSTSLQDSDGSSTEEDIPKKNITLHALLAESDSESV